MLAVVTDLYAGNSWEAYQNSVSLMISKTQSDSIYPILFMDVANTEGKPFNHDKVRLWPNEAHMSKNMEIYRFDEINHLISTSNGFTFEITYSVRKLGKIYAIISLARMIFITFIMAISILFFQQTSTNLVLNPIERMLEKVKLIARNPLAAA